MNGNITAQFLYAGYHTNLAQVVAGYATQILGAMAAIMQALVMLYILLLGKKMMFNAITWDAGVTRMVRAIIVTSLLTAANYQTFVATPVTTTVPNFISTLSTGQQGLQGAQGFDALLNQIQNFSAHARAQMVGFLYIGDRAVLWLVGQLAEIIVLSCLFIWSLSTASADMLVPLGGVLIPFYLFDATRNFVERWYGKIAALFIVSLLVMMLGQIVVYQDAQFMQQHMQAIAANPPNADFNATPELDGGAYPFAPTTPGGQAGPTMNTDAALDTLGSAVLVFAYGLFLLILVTGIGLYIGGASGFTAAPAFNAISAGLGKLARRRS